MKKKIPILIKYFQKSKEKEMLPNSFYEAKIDLLTRQDVDTRGKINVQANIPDEHTL